MFEAMQEMKKDYRTFAIVNACKEVEKVDLLVCAVDQEVKGAESMIKELESLSIDKFVEWVMENNCGDTFNSLVNFYINRFKEHVAKGDKN